MNKILIRTKFLMVAILLIVGIAFMAFAFAQSTSQVKEMAKLANIVKLTKLQMRVDMMHDAIHGNVLQAMPYTLDADKKNNEIFNIQKDMEENFATARGAFKEIIELPISDDIKQPFVELEKKFSRYIEAAGKMIDNVRSKDVHIRQSYDETFLPLFKTLVDDQEHMEEELTKWTDEHSAHSIKQTDDLIQQISLIVFITIALSIFFPVYAFYSLFSPQRKLLSLADAIINNKANAQKNIPYTHRLDEIGALAKILNALKTSNDTKAAVADAFEQKVKNVVDIVAAASTQMVAAAEGLCESSVENQQKTDELSSNVVSAGLNIEQASVAVQQIYSSMNEISKQISIASTINQNAVSEASHVNGLAETLSLAANKVNDINNIITSIAGKINLLSLNATIEAARAGEAGKGFAVVASEVKALANQTATSASEITQHIQSIQESSQNTLAGVKGIGDVISQINNISSTIASAIEEQGMGTRDIAQNMKAASTTAGIISVHAESAKINAKQTGQSAHEMLTAAKELSRQATVLSNEVGSFLYAMRA
jgi:methyl-accepting chemotaxis protein